MIFKTDFIFNLNMCEGLPPVCAPHTYLEILKSYELETEPVSSERLARVPTTCITFIIIS